MRGVSGGRTGGKEGIGEKEEKGEIGELVLGRGETGWLI